LYWVSMIDKLGFKKKIMVKLSEVELKKIYI
jgi:hypothetical protein